MSAHHTPGPWTAEYCCYTDSETTAVGEGSFQILDGPDSRTAAVLCTRLRWPERAREMEANARLIAAAPALLEVLQELEESSGYWSEYDVPLGIVERIKDAIALATGTTA